MSLIALITNLTALEAQTQEAEGYLEPGRNIKISSAEPGIVQAVQVREGQAVQAGDILVKLDTSVLDLEAKIVEEEYRMLTARLERLKSLIPQKFASEDELTRAESDHRITALKRDQIEAQIERLTLRSPIDGVVTELRYDLGEGVSGTNAHVATVVQLAPMNIQFNLPLNQAAHLQPDQTVEVLFPDFDTSRRGTIDYISPVSIAVVNTVRVKVKIPEPDGLPAGIRGQLTLIPGPAITSTSPPSNLSNHEQPQ